MVQSTTMENGSEKTFCFLSELLGKKVFGQDHKVLGKVQDLVALMTERYPEIEGLILSAKGEELFVPARSEDLVKLASGKNVTLGATPVAFARAERQFLVRATLYDKQIVDVNGAKVERVNDVQILVYAEKPFLVHVDVGFSGLSRRLGIEGGLRSLAKAFGKSIKDELIGWKFVQPISEEGQGALQLSLRQEEMRKLHAGELADIIEELDGDERLALLRSIPTGEAAEALEETDLKVQTSILRSMDSELAADILEEMEPAIAVDVIEELPEEIQTSIMAAMEDEEREQIERLSQAKERTAASLMTVDFISCPQSYTVAEALRLIKENAEEVEYITYLYCVDEHAVLCGVVSLRNLIIAESGVQLSEIMNPRLAALKRGDDWDLVADEFWKYGFKALPVVDGEGHVEGIVTFRHSFEELLDNYYKLAS